MLAENRLLSLLEPYIAAPVTGPGQGGDDGQKATELAMADVAPRLLIYLDLLLKWNLRTNLTAIRDPEDIVRRHFGESLFAARLLARRIGDGGSVLDIGSGAGFPGLPTQLLLPDVHVVLAESQGKKAAFLREVVRETGAKAEVWSSRAQDLPAERRFAAVTMRAVDRPEQAVKEGLRRLEPGGYLLHLCGSADAQGEVVTVPGLAAGVVSIVRG